MTRFPLSQADTPAGRDRSSRPCPCARRRSVVRGDNEGDPGLPASPAAVEKGLGGRAVELAGRLVRKDQSRRDKGRGPSPPAAPARPKVPRAACRPAPPGRTLASSAAPRSRPVQRRVRQGAAAGRRCRGRRAAGNRLGAWNTTWTCAGTQPVARTQRRPGDLPRGRRGEAAENVQQRGFAAARGADERDAVVGRDRQVNRSGPRRACAGRGETYPDPLARARGSAIAAH